MALEVTDSAGTLIATVEYPLTVQCTERLSAIGALVATVYTGSPGASALIAGRYLRFVEGSYTWWGVIESVARAAQADGTEIITVTAADIARELAWLTAGPLEFAEFGIPMALTDALARLLSAVPTGWVYNTGAGIGALTVYLAADGASVYTLLLSIAAKLGCYVVRSGAARTLTLSNTWSSSGVTARSVSGDKGSSEAALLDLQRVAEAADVVTVVYPYTAGNAAVRLGLEQASAAAPAGTSYVTKAFPLATGVNKTIKGLRNTAGAATWGDRERVVQFPDLNPLSNSKPDIVAAANAMQTAAANWLAEAATLRNAYALVVDDAPALVQPMQTLAVVWGDLDATLYCVEATHLWTPGAAVRSTLQVTEGQPWPEDGSDAVVRAMEAARVYRAHAQLAPNVYQLAFTRPVDAQYGADFRFRFDEGITQLLFVALDFQVSPLQSTVRAIAAAGVKTSPYSLGSHQHTFSESGHTHTTPAHDHSTVFSGHAHTGPSHTHGYTTIAHVHQIKILKVSTAGSDFNDVRLNAAAPNDFQVTVGSGAGTSVTTPTESTGGASTETGAGGTGATGMGLIGTFPTQAGQGGGTTGPGTVSGSTNFAGGFTHDHTVDVSVTMEYGIYRDSAANAYALADLEYQVNGGAWAALSGATSLGDGWYRLDVTGALVDAIAFTPLQKSNRVSVRALVASASQETFAVGTVNAGSISTWNDAGAYQQIIGGTVTQALALSVNNWLYLLHKATGAIGVYAPGAGTGTLALWETWGITPNTYNAICVDQRTGDKWWAGINGQIYGYQRGLYVLAGSPTLLYVAAFGGNIYVTSSGTLYRVNTNIFGWPVTSVASAGQPLAAMSDGRVVTFSAATAGFALRVLAGDLTGAVNYVRSDAGNAWTPLAIASAANLVHVGCSDGRVRTYALSDPGAAVATLVWTSTGTPGATGYPASTSLLGVSAVLSSKAAMVDAQLTVRSVVQAIVMN